MNRPPEACPEVLIEFFSNHGAALDELSESLHQLYDAGRRSLPAGLVDDNGQPIPKRRHHPTNPRRTRPLRFARGS
jgi:hypothetical protein